MQKSGIRRGRPKGSVTFDAAPAQAFGATVRALRSELGIAQETLALMAGVERSHMGKVERGEHMPTLALILKIARGMGVSSAELMLGTEHLLDENGAPGPIEAA